MVRKKMAKRKSKGIYLIEGTGIGNKRTVDKVTKLSVEGGKVVEKNVKHLTKAMRKMIGW
jgi:hypothetical protein